jgi:hypothetical protein
VAKGDLQGWHPDPFGLHEARYFSVGNPTKLVRDGHAESYDEPPDPVPAAASVAAVSAPSAETAVSGPSAVTAGMLPQGGPELADATRVLPTGVGDGPTGLYRADPGPLAPRKRRGVEYAFVAAGAIVAVLVFVVLEGGSHPPGIAPAAFVTRAAQHTLAQHTADFMLSSTANVGGQSFAMGGSGQIDLATDAMSFNVGASTATGSITENELQVGGIRYLRITVNGRSLALSGGRQWIEMPYSATPVQSFATSSPESSLALLSQQGARVTPLGSLSIGGQNCNGYAVTPSSQATLAGARQWFAKIGMSTAATNAALQALQNVQPPTITAWFGSQNYLACQVTVSMQFGNPSSSGSGGVQARLTFTHYGVPVEISAPPASDTVSLQQYLHGTTHL